jgi:hypothetical protein
MLLKKLDDEDFIKIIEGFKCVVINTNFIFHQLLYFFIDINYNRSLPFKNPSIILIKFSQFNL